MSKVFDLFIIGGGINGAGIARDAAGRGLSVCLADKGEIGGATSSWSTKLIHGGHGGKSGRDSGIEEIAFDYSFILKMSKTKI